MPKLTVIMPAYNAAPYLREAIDSILSQTFTDFEFIIIDDGSTDNTRDIVDSYDDVRIIKQFNIKNIGVAACLNKGVALASGEYIARMDADDVSMPRRFEKQVSFLNAHQDVSVVAVKAVLIDASGRESGYWSQDQLTTNNNQVREMLAKRNCIVHPAVMLRRVVLQKYGYNENQSTTEDYDLWLRMAADNHKIEKIDSLLLKYRIHKDSITVKSNCSADSVFKEVHTRLRFLVTAFNCPHKINWFHLNVLNHVILDFCRICLNLSKNIFLVSARNIFISFGKVIGSLYQKYAQSRHDVILFLSFSLDYIGGAERIHKDIVRCNISKAPWVILANQWNDEDLQSDITRTYKFTVISRLLSNPFSRNLAIGFYAGYINHAKCVVFGGNSDFFYLLVPHLDTEIFCVDFIHGFGGLLEYISLPYVQRINRRVVIAEELLCEWGRLYFNHGIPDEYLERFLMIDYGVDVPSSFQRKPNAESRLNILYVGRGSEEKRVHLVGRIARTLSTKKLPISVDLIGDVHSALAIEDLDFCTCYGPIFDRDTLNSHYNKTDVLVITSRREGLPLVLMEAMAHGVVPIAVAVGGISSHIDDGVTGFLVSPEYNEDEIVMEFCQIIEKLANDRHLLHQVSLQSYEFASSHFDRSIMLDQFAKLFDV